MLARLAVWGAALVLPALSPAWAQDAPAARLELRPGVVLEVNALQRVPDKGVVVGRFTLSNSGEAAVSLDDLGIAEPHGIKNISLLDFKNGREYVIGNGYSGCLCTRIESGETVGPGERKAYWAMYGNPPADVVKVGVMVHGLPPLFDVALTK